MVTLNRGIGSNNAGTDYPILKENIMKLVPELKFLPQDNKEENILVRGFKFGIRFYAKLIVVAVPAIVVIGVVGGAMGGGA